MTRPFVVALPGGRRATLDPGVDVREPRRAEPWKDEIVDALAGAVAVAGTALDREGVLDLTLAEFHTLRYFVERQNAEPEEYVCRNCDRPFDVDPYTLLPERHFQERLGEERPAERTFDLPEPVRTRSGTAKTVTLRSVTVRESRPLREAIVRPRGWDVTAAIVGGMGITSLGDERDTRRIARALARAPDRVWNEVAAAFDEMAYPAGLAAPAFCPACEARNDIVLPPERELHIEPPEPAGDAGPFMDADSFASAVERIGHEVFEARGVRGLVLVADAGTPPCDQGGEPLLGSYQVLPPDDHALRPDITFEVSLFYQSFKKTWVEDGAYDVEAEIEDTIDHEVEHHFGHLAGRDEQDEEEVEEIKRELVQTYGKQALAAGLAADFVRDFGRFVRTFWPALVLAAVVVVAGVCVNR